MLDLISTLGNIYTLGEGTCFQNTDVKALLCIHIRAPSIDINIHSSVVEKVYINGI